MLMCSLGMRVMVTVSASNERSVAILADTSVRVVTGMWSIATRILCRSVECQRGIRAVGVDAMHEVRMMQSLSE